MLHRRHFPALEDFCLVVCHVCNQVVTPQGILAHYGKAQRSAASWEDPDAGGGPVRLMEEDQPVPSGLFKHGLRAPEPPHRQQQQPQQQRRLKRAKLFTHWSAKRSSTDYFLIEQNGAQLECPAFFFIIALATAAR